jgi:hypothetical protein
MRIGTGAAGVADDAALVDAATGAEEELGLDAAGADGAAGAEEAEAAGAEVLVLAAPREPGGGPGVAAGAVAP